MKAIVIREFGPPGVMKLEEVPTPEPGPGEVLIKVHAVSVNRTLDTKVRAGTYARPVTLPLVPGVDPSGVIVKLGEGVTHRKVGDRVTVALRLGNQNSGADALRLLGVHAWGGYAEYVRAIAANTTIVPDNVDFPTATVVTRHAPMAFHMLRDHAKVAARRMGAGDGRGRRARQRRRAGREVSRRQGDRGGRQRRSRQGRSRSRRRRRRELPHAGSHHRGGAHHRRQGRQRGVREHRRSARRFPKAFAAMARRGRLVTAGGHGGGIVPLDVNKLYLNQITIMGRTGETETGAADSLKMASEGKFKALIDRVLPLSRSGAGSRDRREPRAASAR